MPTAITHAAAGLGVAHLLAPRPSSTVAALSYYGLALTLSLAPDLDVLAFRAGIPYRHRWGHRGISHSLVLAPLAGLFLALAAALSLDMPWWRLWIAFFLTALTHTLLDALTDGGLGVALFSPFSEHRYFFPWRPIRVSPIGWAAFSSWGWRALRSEILWVWVPLGFVIVVFHFFLGMWPTSPAP